MPSDPYATRPATPTRVRPEIQALRALAVGFVLVYHLSPNLLPGGYAGVDVFFVISGFLITAHLLREVVRTGRVDLPQFWARRARRLLPAALLVLTVSALAVVAVVPNNYWHQFFTEIAASALYVENWALAASSVDYLGAENDPSPAQHYWSLSVEEQFYLVWPLLVLLSVWVGTRLLRRRLPSGELSAAALADDPAVAGAAGGTPDTRSGRRAADAARAADVPGASGATRPAFDLRWTATAVLGAVGLLSLVVSVVLTDRNPSWAYFVTPTRAWEFAAGALLAIWLPVAGTGRQALRSVVSWLGVAGLLVTAFAYSGATPFPGYTAALPVLATLAVIWAGVPSPRWSPRAALTAAPAQWLGGVSYSAYLWHWPLIVAWVSVVGRHLGLVEQAVALAVTLLLAWATTRYVEDPVRTSGTLLRRRPRLTYGLTLAGMAVVVAVCVAGIAGVDRTVDDTRRELAALQQNGDECLGAGATDPEHGCDLPYAVTRTADPATAAADIGVAVAGDAPCKTTLTGTDVVVCEFGETQVPTRTIALVGDSHAAHFVEGLDLAGQRNGWKVVTYLKSWCAGLGVPNVGAHGNNADPAARSTCADWGVEVRDAILADPGVDAVLFSNFAFRYSTDLLPEDQRLTREAAAQALRPYVDAGLPVLVMRPVPTGSLNVPACVGRSGGEYDPCSYVRDEVLRGSPLLDAIPDLDGRAAVVDVTDRMCDDVTCHTVIGGVIAYFDRNHISATFSASLGSVLGVRIGQALAGVEAVDHRAA